MLGRKWNTLILKSLSCHLRRRLWPIFSFVGLGSVVMLQNQLHPPFFSPLLFLLDPNCSFRSLWPRKHLAKLEFINYWKVKVNCLGQVCSWFYENFNNHSWCLKTIALSCSGAKGINDICNIKVSKIRLPLFALCLEFEWVPFNLITRHTPREVNL